MPEYVATSYQLTDPKVRLSLNMKQYMQQHMLFSGYQQISPTAVHMDVHVEHMSPQCAKLRVYRVVYINLFFIFNSFAACFDNKVYK